MDDQLPTVPAVREWMPASGMYRATPSSRLIVDAAFVPELTGTAAQITADLQTVTGYTLPMVLASTGDARPGDIVVTLMATGLPTDGHQLHLGDIVTIGADTATGAFLASRTLVQLLGITPALRRGVVRDWPLLDERGLMVDIGRKYLSAAWLGDRIRELAYLKMNRLHLHLSDEFGFRLESVRHPEVMSPDHYTRTDIALLLAVAAAHHVTLVPEIDFPGHQQWLLAEHPELQLVDQRGQAETRYIDLSAEAAFTFMREILEEAFGQFPGGQWHIGADEYVRDYGRYPQLGRAARARFGADAIDADIFHGFVNWANHLVRANGRTARMWSDGVREDGVVAIDDTLIVEHWDDQGKPPSWHIAAGRQVVNASYDWTYHILTPSGIRSPDLEALFSAWEPTQFQGGHRLSPDETQLLGAKLHVWCDQPSAADAATIADCLAASLPIMAQKTWGTPANAPTWEAFQQRVARIGRAPRPARGPDIDLAV